MKQILDDFAPLLNAKIVQGESQEEAEEQKPLKSLPSSSHKKEESLSDPQK